MLSSEAGRERPAEARLRWWLGGSGFPPALAPLGLLWNSLSARCCHALGCEWHLTFGGGLLGAGRRPGRQAATLWGQLGTAGPGRNRAVPRPAGGWAGAFGYKGDPAATQGETWGFRGRGMVCLGWLLCWACPWSWLSPAPTARKKLRPGKAGLATVALSHRLDCKPGEWGPGPGSPGQGRGFSFLPWFWAWEPNSSPPRPPESPGNFPVTAGSAARAIYNSHSCSAGSLGSGAPWRARGRGSPLLRAEGPV